MHELAVTESILSIAMEAAQKADARRILVIDLVIGELSSIVDDSVQFYFDILSKGTIAEDARLRFNRKQAEAVCWDCDHEFAVSAPLLHSCPNCGSARMHITEGKEFSIESIEVENEDSNPKEDPGRE
jgi:hydrogenase nickel incorporation protein HypA/HybF